MVQLTGRQTGTPQDDIFAGEIELLSLEESRTEIGALNATINGLGGADRISGIVRIDSESPNLDQDATGVAQSTFNGGIGNDIISGSGTSFGNVSETTGEFSGTATGTGVLRSSVQGGDGDDALTFSGVGVVGTEVVGTGARSTSIDGGGGTDDINIRGTAFGIDSQEQGSVRAIATSNSTVIGGSQSDDIDLIAEARGVNRNATQEDSTAVAIAADTSFISGDGGNDTIGIRTEGNAFTAELSAVSNSEVRAGSGDDLLGITSSTLPDRTADNLMTNSATTSAVIGDSLVSADAGNDNVFIRATAKTTSVASAFGVNGAAVAGGNGADTLTIIGEANSATGEAFSAFEATVDGGNDSDTITLRTTLEGGNVSGASANQSTISGGAGDDELFFEVNDNTSQSQQDTTGLLKSEVYGNSGDDTITVRTSEQVNYNIIDSQLFGGAGDDFFDVGIGSGKLVGGAGNDTAVLDYLTAQTTNITAINNGIRISGTQTNTGAAGDWTQDILGVESYLVDGTTYTNDTLVQTFG